MLYSSVSIISSTTILLALLIFFLTTRFLARHRSSHHLHNNRSNNSHHTTPSTPPGPSSGIGADDWVALAAALGSTIGCLLILISANQALGRHTSYATPAQVESVLLLIWLDQINYLIVMALAKTSTLLLYTRIFHGEQQRRFRLVCWFTMAVVGLTSVLLMIFSIIMCRPVEYFWTRVHLLVVAGNDESAAAAAGGKCKDNRPYLYANTVISIVTDMVIVVLPIRQIVGLQMARKKKVTVCALFGLGMIVIVCSIMRATKVEDAANATDPMVNLSGLCVWSLVESAVSVICCCVPASHRLIRDFFVDLFGREQEGEEKTKQQGGIPQALQPDSKPITRTWEDDSEAGDMSGAVDPRW